MAEISTVPEIPGLPEGVQQVVQLWLEDGDDARSEPVRASVVTNRGFGRESRLAAQLNHPNASFSFGPLPDTIVAFADWLKDPAAGAALGVLAQQFYTSIRSRPQKRRIRWAAVPDEDRARARAVVREVYGMSIDDVASLTIRHEELSEGDGTEIHFYDGRRWYYEVQFAPGKKSQVVRIKRTVF